MCHEFNISRNRAFLIAALVLLVLDMVFVVGWVRIPVEWVAFSPDDAKAHDHARAALFIKWFGTSNETHDEPDWRTVRSLGDGAACGVESLGRGSNAGY